MRLQDKGKVLLIRVVAQNNASGGPRRGWVYVDQNGAYLSFIDEGYEGSHAIEEFRKAGVAETITLNITPKQYNDLIKRERTCSA
jgi:hypothetical protein